MFRRDETYELLEYLTNLALQKVLKSTFTEPAPGLAFIQPELNADMLTSPAAILGLTKGNQSIPLKQAFEIQRKNTIFQNMFNLFNESILQEMTVLCSISGTNISCHGKLYLSNTFFCFTSTKSFQCQLALPFFAVIRVERINTQTSTIAITARHELKLLFQFIGDKSPADLFCEVLKTRLQEHVPYMKLLGPFLSTCPSEDFLAGREVKCGGLGIKYGFIDLKK